MRDDIHKYVPRPPAVRRWIQRCVSDAERRNGRSFAALSDLVGDACASELPRKFIEGMQRELSGGSGLFSALETVTSIRQVGGNGRPLELEVLSETQRQLALGTSPESALVEAITVALDGRCQADIRATKPVLPVNDRKTPVVLAQMRDDAARFDFRGHAEALCAGQSPPKAAIADGGDLAEVDLIQNFKPKVTAR
jgi:hypothetical protein